MVKARSEAATNAGMCGRVFMAFPLFASIAAALQPGCCSHVNMGQPGRGGKDAHAEGEPAEGVVGSAGVPPAAAALRERAGETPPSRILLGLLSGGSIS